MPTINQLVRFGRSTSEKKKKPPAAEKEKTAAKPLTTFLRRTNEVWKVSQTVRIIWLEKFRAQ